MGDWKPVKFRNKQTEVPFHHSKREGAKAWSTSASGYGATIQDVIEARGTRKPTNAQVSRQRVRNTGPTERARSPPRPPGSSPSARPPATRR